MKTDIQEKSITLDVDELVTWLLCRKFGAESDTGAGSVLEKQDEESDFSSLLPQRFVKSNLN